MTTSHEPLDHDLIDVTHYADGIDCECPDVQALGCDECGACQCETCETGHWVSCSNYV